MPQLTIWTSAYWEAWSFLRGSRSLGFGAVGWIPVSEIIAYLDLIREDDPEERLRYLRMVLSLDDLYVSKMNERKPSAKPPKLKPQTRRVFPRR